jgi:hypothetical protein
MNETPSQQLAARIVERLIAEKLLSPANGQKLLANLADGKLRPEDWRLPLELASDQEAKP